MRNSKTIYALVLLSVVVAAVNAAVFVYNPVNLNLSTVKPPIIFEEGSNAGGSDLGGNNIGVDISSSHTGVTITVHPTYGTTYYKNITVIENQGTETYYVAFKVEDSLYDSKISSALLIVKDQSGTTKYTLDLTNTGTTDWALTLNGGVKYYVDLSITIDGSTGSPDQAPSLGDTQAKVSLIYSPQNTESPP